MVRLKFHVTGMQSIYCAQVLQRTLNRLPGVTSYVLYKQAWAEVQAPDDLPVASLLQAAQSEGYRLQPLHDTRPREQRPGSAPQRRSPGWH